MKRPFFTLPLAAALLLSACGVGDQDRLTGDPAVDEGTAAYNDAELNGAIDADQELAEAVAPPPSAPKEVPLADIVDPLAPVAAAEPAFDCPSAWRDAERAICDDPQLAALDKAMSARYFRALKAADPARAAQLQQSAAAFLRNRNRCQDVECIASAYGDRLAEIDEIMGGVR